MDEQIRNLSGSNFVGMVAIVSGATCFTIISVVGIIAPLWNRSKQVVAEAQLKRDLIAAGYTADDIERVVKATAAGDSSDGSSAHAGCRHMSKPVSESASPASV